MVRNRNFAVPVTEIKLQSPFHIPINKVNRRQGLRMASASLARAA